MDSKKGGKDAMSKREKAAGATKSTLQTELVPLVLKFFKGFAVLSGVWLIGYYRYSVSWVLLGLPVWLWAEHKEMKQQRKRRVQHQICDSEKEVILATIDDLPSWVFFPDVERAEWLNKMMLQMWPYIGDFATKIMKEIVEPSVRENLPPTLRAFAFEKVDLGDIAPRVGGIKLYKEHVHRDEIIMDMEIFYAGDMNIKVAVSRMRVGCKNITMHGTMRVVMKPLISVSPLVGAVTVYFLNNPDIDFDLTNLGNVMDFPGLSDILRKIVIAQVANFVVMPNSITVPLTDTVNLKELKFRQPNGVLRIEVVEAKDLKKMDIGLTGKGKSDPYAVIAVGATQYKTKTINNTVAPVWNSFFEAIVGECKGQSLDVELFDEDPGVSQNDFLGRTSIDIYSVAKKGREDSWMPLEDIKHGDIHLRLDWLSLSSDPCDLDRIRAETSNMLTGETKLSTAVLMVFLDSGVSLPNARKSASEPSPVVTFSVVNKKWESTIKHATNHPVWEERCVFLIQNPEMQDLDIQVKDFKTEKSLGVATVPIAHVLKAHEMEIRQPFPLKESGQDSQLKLWLRLRILKPGALSSERDESLANLTEETTDGTEKPSAVEEEAPAVSSNTAPTANEANASQPAVEEIPSWKANAPVASDPSTVRQRQNKEVSQGEDAGLGKVQLTISYSADRKRLIVVVHKCADLLPCDDDNLADPYVRIYLLPDKSSASKRKTQVVKNTLNPVFDETMEYIGSVAELQHKTLDVTVKNQVGIFARGRNIIGQVLIDLAEVDLTKAMTQWFHLSRSGRETSP